MSSNKMTKVKVLEGTAAAKPLKTNDARQNISIQESSTVMARLLVITRSSRDIDLRKVISKHELSTINCLLHFFDGMAVVNEQAVFKGVVCNCEELAVHFVNTIVRKSSGYKHSYVIFDNYDDCSLFSKRKYTKSAN